MTVNNLSQLFRSKMKISKDVTDFKARIFHKDHSFKLSELISSVQKNNSIICPICNQNADSIFYNKVNNEEILDIIKDDDDTKLINYLPLIKDNFCFYSNYKMPKIISEGPSYLSLSAFFGSRKCFDSFLHFIEENDIPFNILDLSNRSPIHFACFTGDLEIFGQIILFNDDENALDILSSSDLNGLHPIHYATMNGQINVVEYLHANGLNMFSSTNDENKSPLHFACQYGHLNVIKYYIMNVIPNSSFLVVYADHKKNEVLGMDINERTLFLVFH